MAAAAKPAPKSDYLAAFHTTRRFKNLFLLIVTLALLVQIAAWILVEPVGVLDAIHSIESADEASYNQAAAYESILMRVLGWSKFLGFLSAILLCITLNFSARISLVDRLGGTAGFVRAMFWALLAGVMVTPWQNILDLPHSFAALSGHIELITAVAETKESWHGPIGQTARILHLARMVGYPTGAVLALLIAQINFARGYRLLGTTAAANSANSTPAAKV